MSRAGRPADLDRYRQALRWVREGKTNAWIGEQLGLRPGSTKALIARAIRWQAEQGLSEATSSALHAAITSDAVLNTLDEMITDGLKVQAAAIRPVLEDVRRELPDLKRAVGTLLERMVIMEAAIERIERRAPVVAAPSATETPKTARPADTTPPPALWVWIAQECSRHLGRQGTADALGVEVKVVTSWLSGTTPKSSERDELRNLLATLWARETFVDFDDVEDARSRLPTAQNAGAEA